MFGTQSDVLTNGGAEDFWILGHKRDGSTDTTKPIDDLLTIRREFETHRMVEITHDLQKSGFT